MKIIKRLLVAITTFFIIVSAFYFFWLSPRYVVPILMYHRFGYGENNLFVTPENFKRQMVYIKGNGYDVISLDELVDGIRNNRRFKHKTVVITIDDGYRDNYSYAYPILKKYNFPATIFIATNFIGNNKDFMSLDKIKAMSKNGISFGGHTKSHAYLPSVGEKTVLWSEIKGCKEFIEEKIGVDADYFCYPTGGFNEEVKATVRKAEYKGACATNRGFVELNKDVYELKRVKITNSDTNKPFSFWAKLSGYYNVFRSKKRGY
ncbi:MAG TPA: polysaccharide deacetylase family protein [Candidatus Omnitrophica bacterium]|nr:polysaccharide deacetylase family protein [Candidatus Omnitrophota bacterium]